MLFAKGSGTETAWDYARNIANIMFIMAFLIIIISQVSGMGINNYGVKKMLPRLIIGAVLVNVSFYVCQLAVDLSNIFGYEIEDALAKISNGLGPSVFGTAANYTANSNWLTAQLDGGTILETIAGAALGGVAVYFIAPSIIPIALFCIVTVMVCIVILLLRKALLVLLVVISPIAFVMYLLPNTERYFRKWMNMFGQLLLVFPTVGLLFGAGQLASTIILISGAESNQAVIAASENCNPDNQLSQATFNGILQGNPASQNTYAQCAGKYIIVDGPKTDGSGQTSPLLSGDCAKGAQVCKPRTVSWTLGLVATGVAIAPLLAVWAVLKGSLSAAGAIGGKITGMVQNAGNKFQSEGNKLGDKLNNRIKENAAGAWQRSQARGLSGEGSWYDNVSSGFASKNARRHDRLERSKAARDRAAHDQIAAQLHDRGEASELLSGLPEAARERAIRGAEAEHRKTQADEISAETLAIAHLNETALENKGNKLVAEGKFNSPELAAILQQIEKIDQASFMRLASKVTGTGMNLATRTVSENMASGFYGGGDKAAVLGGKSKIDLTAMAANNVFNGSMSSNNLAGLSNDKIKALAGLVGTNTTSRANIEKELANLSADQKGNLSGAKKTNLNNIVGKVIVT